MVERAEIHDHWKAEMSAEERERLTSAWQAHRSCLDCEHYDVLLPNKTGGCTAPENRRPCASFMVPEDFTCEHWVKLTEETAAEREETRLWYAEHLAAQATNPQEARGDSTGETGRG